MRIHWALSVAALSLSICSHAYSASPSPPTNPFPPDGGTLCPSPYPELNWSLPQFEPVLADVVLDGVAVCIHSQASCYVPMLAEGWHTWQVINKGLNGGTTEGPIWSFHTGASEETCDGFDNDCDGELDEDLTRPCENSCASGTETCTAGHWLACSARPCCDITLGPGSGLSLCPTAEATSAVLCLEPGTYYVPAGCQVRSSLVGTGDPEATIIEGNISLNRGPTRIQGLTVTGFVRSEWPLDLLENRLLGGASLHYEEGGGGGPMLQVSHNEIRHGLGVAFSSFVHANDIMGGLCVGQHLITSYHAAIENHIRGTGGIGIQVNNNTHAYIARNVVEGFDVGISNGKYPLGLQIVSNKVVARSVGIDVADQGSGEVSLLRNDVVYAGDSGIVLTSDASRVEGNQVVRDPNGLGTSDGYGVFINIYPPEGVLFPTSFRDNTIVGGPVRFEQQINTLPVQMSGNVIVTQGGTGVLVCARDACPASPPYSLVPTNNDVFASAAPWVGTDDPTGRDGNISADPLFRDPVAGDYRPTPGSPCMDAGVNGYLLVDLFGGPRVHDGDGDGQAIPDMGAREAEYEPCHDGDGDGFGSPGNANCAAGAATDCDDANPQINPGSVDLPGNTVDENCDGSPGACDPDQAGGWGNHGQFVRCVAQEVQALVARGAITKDLGEQLISTAARSRVGK